MYQRCCVSCSDFGPEWKSVYDSPSPHECKLPDPWDIKLKGLDRWAVVMCMLLLYTAHHYHASLFSMT